MKPAFCHIIVRIVVTALVNNGCIKSESEPAITYRTVKVLTLLTQAARFPAII